MERDFVTGNINRSDSITASNTPIRNDSPLYPLSNDIVAQVSGNPYRKLIIAAIADIAGRTENFTQGFWPFFRHAICVQSLNVWWGTSNIYDLADEFLLQLYTEIIKWDCLPANNIPSAGFVSAENMIKEQVELFVGRKIPQEEWKDQFMSNDVDAIVRVIEAYGAQCANIIVENVSLATKACLDAMDHLFPGYSADEYNKVISPVLKICLSANQSCRDIFPNEPTSVK